MIQQICLLNINILHISNFLAETPVAGKENRPVALKQFGFYDNRKGRL